MTHNKNLKPLSCLLINRISARSAPKILLLKVVFARLLLVCFVCLKDATCEKRKNVFYSTAKAHSVLVVIEFDFSNIQMSCHQMPKHETLNTFSGITWEC